MADRRPPSRAAAPVRRRPRWPWIALTTIVVAAAVMWLTVGRRASPKGPNLLLITIDTLRADHVGAYGATTAATPALDALAAEGVRFDQVQTAAPLTGPSHATILTGLYPPMHGVRNNVVFSLGKEDVTLATLLKRRGYRTAAFVGAYPVAAAFGFGQGFDTFDEEFHETAPGEQGAERRANEVADAAVRWLTEGPAEAGHRDGGPFFMWTHFYDPHAPYDPPPPYRERFADHPYDGEIAFTDAQVKRVLDALQQTGHHDDTVVMLLADHGEGLGDHHELTHAVLVYQSTMRVPMIVAGAGVPRNRVVSTRVGTIDVLPTALGLLGLQADKALLGRDLRPLINGSSAPGDPLYAESLFGRLSCHWASLRAWVKDDWKLIVGAEPELYNITQDPREETNLAREQPDRVARMRDELQRALGRLAPGGDKAESVRISADQEQRLRSLGYAAGSGGGGPLDDPSLPDPRTHVMFYDGLQQALVVRGPGLPRAFAQIEAIVAADPGNPFAHGALATMSYQYGSLALAAREFVRVLEIEPDRPGVRQNYGKLLRELGRYTESERELRAAIAQTPEEDSRLTISLAETLIAERKLDEAGRLISSVLAKEPRNQDALGAKGRLLLAENRAADAVTYLEQATETSDVEPFIELARGDLKAGEPARARDAAGEALRRSPGHPWAMAVLGAALVREGQRSAGVEYMQRAMAAGPRRPVVWETLAEGFEAANDPALAAACRRRAVEASELGIKN
jgi:arylsulfatase A-like enzyme/Tfp pilus assembly protein PilF